MFSDADPEEEEKYIDKAAEFISQFQFDTIATMLLQVNKPLAFLYGSLLRVSFLPYTMMFGIDNNTSKIISTFEKKENIDKLIKEINKKQIVRKDQKKNNTGNLKKDEKGLLGKIRSFILK